jgi:hypothetical protein
MVTERQQGVICVPEWISVHEIHRNLQRRAHAKDIRPRLDEADTGI